MRRAVRLSLVAAAASVAMPAVAQTGIDAVVVTGTRIAKRDAVAESPILSVTNDDMVSSGYVTVDHVLNTLPQIVPSVSSQSNNPSSNGRAFVDLRGLGTNRNLVLIDGRRGMGSTSGGVVDVNTIPASLIERVEVISGGAAAVYGADAIAGVVNFIMKKDFEGFEINSGYYLTEQEDGQQVGLDITAGGKFADGKGSAVFNASYYDREAMYKGARSFAAEATSTTGIFPGGSWSPGANAPTQATVDALFGPNACNTTGGDAGFGFNPNGSPFCTGVLGNPNRNAVGFTGPDSWIAHNFYPDRFSYNFEPDNILVLPMERWNVYSNVSLDLGEHFQPYVQAIFTNYNAKQELAATPGSIGTVPRTNPFVPAALIPLLDSRATPGAGLSMAYRFNALGGRTGDNNHDVWQLVTGTKGALAGDWSYDLYYSYGRAVQTEVQGGNVRVPRVTELLNAPDGGASICAGGFNPFGDNPLSPACQAYIGLQAKNQTLVEMANAEFTVTGDLFDVPAGPVQVAIGAGWREIELDFKPDSGLQPGQVIGFNEQLPIQGRLDYVDLFTEFSIPLLKDVTAVKALSFTGGYRSTDNNIFGTEDSWKATLDWSITDSWRFRGGLQRAVRSPNISELFAPQVNNFPNWGNNNDPCNTVGVITTHPQMGRAGPNGAAVAALCAAQSAAAGLATFNQAFGQAQALAGGNPTLQPETADSWTAGFVFTSNSNHPMLERLTVSLDYVSIELEDVIAAFSAFNIIQRCYNRENANPTYSNSNPWCQMFQREAATGRVINVQTLQQNQSFINVSGIDLAVDWGFPLGERAGDLGLSLRGTWTEKFEQQDNITTPVYDYTGTVSQVTGGTTPEFKVNLSTAWTYADLQLQHTMRYIDSMFHANVVTGSSPTTNTGVSDTYYHDLTGRYNLTENISLRAGVNNLGNQKPRLYVPNVQAGTDPSLYDVLGRRYFVSVNMRF
ncbi:MAG: TonB-dependent receptor [Steroidobacteraceae bacterium]|nr:TonB-dependent receptor [Steroidobacteraceae bacterium]